MAEEITNQVNDNRKLSSTNLVQVGEENNIDYIQAIQELKQNTVSKEQYSKLKAENSKLLNSIINGSTDEVVKPERPDINELRKDLYGGESHLSNLEYVSKVLALRNAVIEDGGVDPFLPVGHQIMPDNNDRECANRVATVLQECIDFADGDSGVFTAELQRRMLDGTTRRQSKIV